MLQNLDQNRSKTIKIFKEWSQSGYSVAPELIQTWILENPEALTCSLTFELDRLSKLPSPIAIENLRPHKLGDTDVADYWVLMDGLVDTVSSHGWTAPLLEAGAAGVFLDYISTGASVISVPSTFSLILPLAFLIEALRSPTSTEMLSVKAKACRTMASFICMIDEKPKKHLDVPEPRHPAVVLYYLLRWTDFINNEHCDHEVIGRVIRYGFFLAKTDYMLMEYWFRLPFTGLRLSSNLVNTTAFVEKLGPRAVELVTSMLLTWLKGHTPEAKIGVDIKSLFAGPLLWCIEGENLAIRSAFWDQLAIPLAACWWSGKTDSNSSETRNDILIIFRRALQGIWTEAQSRQAGQALATVDISGILSHLLYLDMRTGRKEGLRISQGFVTSFNKWIVCDDSRVTISLQEIIRPSVEPVFLSSLHKLKLAPTTPLGDTTNIKSCWDSEEDSEDADNCSLSCVECWLQFGSALGLDEVELRRKSRERNSEASKGLVGCNWRGCPLFLTPSEWPMLLCSGCLKVQYCANSTCQKRDWHDGGHKAVCL